MKRKPDARRSVPDKTGEIVTNRVILVFVRNDTDGLSERDQINPDVGKYTDISTQKDSNYMTGNSYKEVYSFDRVDSNVQRS